MKKPISLLLTTLLITTNAISQQCLPNGIVFNTQSEIDNFQANYPNCTEILGDVEINDNLTGNIMNLNGLNVLTSIGGYLEIKFTGALLNLSGFDNLTRIGGDFLAGTNTSLTSLSGLDNLSYVGGSFDVGLNPMLSGLNGLNNLDSVGDYMVFGSNNSLTSLDGLNNLKKIGGRLDIGLNPNLTILNGLKNLSSVGGLLVFGSNASLQNLNDLSNLASIGGELNIGLNDVLSDISGLSNIDANSITDLKIGFNPQLSNCEIKSICDYLASPNGIIQITSNNNGCNSQAEVEAACAAASIEETNIETQIKIFPNPARDVIFIENNSDHQVLETRIFSLTGQLMIREEPDKSFLDILCLKPGIYILEIITEKFPVRKKLVKQ